MKGKDKKLINIIIVISIILVIVVMYFYFPKSVNIEGNALEWQNNNSEYISSRDVKIVGYFHNFIFKNDDFSGNIYIEGVCDLKYTSASIDFNKDYVFIDDFLINNADGPTWGVMIFSRDFSNFSIFLAEDTGSSAIDWSAENSIVLSYPAAKREEAVKLTESLSSKHWWLSNATWK